MSFLLPLVILSHLRLRAIHSVWFHCASAFYFRIFVNNQSFVSCLSRRLLRHATCHHIYSLFLSRSLVVAFLPFFGYFSLLHCHSSCFSHIFERYTSVTLGVFFGFHVISFPNCVAIAFRAAKSKETLDPLLTLLKVFLIAGPASLVGLDRYSLILISVTYLLNHSTFFFLISPLRTPKSSLCDWISQFNYIFHPNFHLIFFLIVNFTFSCKSCPLPLKSWLRGSLTPALFNWLVKTV